MRSARIDYVTGNIESSKFSRNLARNPNLRHLALNPHQEHNLAPNLAGNGGHVPLLIGKSALVPEESGLVPEENR